ncbi:MAG TPA: hypothetical protein VGV38_18655 [Pyrinomonadaceae bacterium]|nr:hypothetical protein [Pyrinomonadaceae bacterium]
MQTLRHLRHLVQWNLRGRPAPPPHYAKQLVIKYYQRRFGPRVFVETGTYLGEMVEAVKSRFDEVYSIELSPELCERAREKFAADAHVHIVEGDSGEVMPSILEKIEGPALFWLDGHFSGGITAQGPLDYPVLKELEHIRRHAVKNHVILVDDARLFLGTPNAPAKEQVVQSIKAVNPAYTVEERDDIIRAYVTEK